MRNSSSAISSSSSRVFIGTVWDDEGMGVATEGSDEHVSAMGVATEGSDEHVSGMGVATEGSDEHVSGMGVATEGSNEFMFPTIVRRGV